MSSSSSKRSSGISQLYDPTIMNSMMTLAQLAATAPDQRPSGEPLALQVLRIYTGITTQLQDTSLATNGQWTPIWLGLTGDLANLAYIAENSSANAIAVCLRGTMFNSLIDLGEDLQVGGLAQFTAAYTTKQEEPLLISQGAMDAFTEITRAVSQGEDSYASGTPLLAAVSQWVTNAGANPTVYVTGHSLGGAMATMVGLYLIAQTYSQQPTFNVYTFAAPTAGLQAFADYYDQMLTNNPPHQAWRVYNAYDAVPNAWASLDNVYKFYPAPGPVADSEVDAIIYILSQSLNGNQYVQTNQENVNAVELNSDYGLYDGNYVCATMADFMEQVGYQHNHYLNLLNAPLIPDVTPYVFAITPNAGSSAGGTEVTITGQGFVMDSEFTVVDFGSLPAIAPVTVESDTVITAYAPAGAGTVDVRVTTIYGTSPVTPVDQFTSPAPVLPPMISTISPPSAPVGIATPITLTGAGFTTGCTVTVGGEPATGVVVVSLTEIEAVTPALNTAGPAAVVVTNAANQSSTSDVNFNFGPPIVYIVDPCSGPSGDKAQTQVTITGQGFLPVVAVLFDGVNVPIATETTPTSTQIVVTAPIEKKDRTVDVVVENSEGKSAVTQLSKFTYFTAL